MCNWISISFVDYCFKLSSMFSLFRELIGTSVHQMVGGGVIQQLLRRKLQSQSVVRFYLPSTFGFFLFSFVFAFYISGISAWDLFEEKKNRRMFC